MSSNDGDGDIDHNVRTNYDQKARNVQRACDACRRKKIRCDGTQIPYTQCTNCIVCSYDCTYVEVAKKRGPPKSYVQSLEKRVGKLQQLLGRIAPEALDKLDKASDAAVGQTDRTLPPSRIPSQPVTLPFIHAITHVPPSAPTHDNEIDSVMLGDNLQDLYLGRTNRFFGKASAVMVHQVTIKLKRDYMASTQGSPVPDLPPVRPPPDPPHDIVTYSFPEEDLFQSLIELYFTQLNIFFPVLHRPTIEKSIADGLHLSDKIFAETVLLLCAIGSRFSDDSRVLLDGVALAQCRGWKWFSQVPLMRDSLLKTPTTESLQFCFLSAMYLQGTTVPQSSWRLAGLGVRVAQDMGAHRRKSRDTVPTAEDETMKRAFWGLVVLDRILSAALGRPCAIQDEDYDVDLPIECDDEYWDHPDPQKRFKQPKDKPSFVTYFIFQIKLCNILAFTLRTLYSVNKSKILLGFAPQQWEESIVGDLDGALNQLIDSIPNHLRWDPNRENRKFFEQSGSLYSMYYQLQILVHRPFIASPSRPTTLPFPALAICTSAARSCSHVGDALLRRSASFDFPLQTSAFFAGIILLLNFWGGKRSGLTTDPHKDLEDVHKCMALLKVSEDRWYVAGRFWDILDDLASVGDMPLPKAVSSTNKRERDEDKPQSFSASAPISSATGVDPQTAQLLGMPRDIVRSGHLPWNSSSSASGSGSDAHSRPLQRPQRQQSVQRRPPLQPSTSRTQRLQGPDQPSQCIRRPPPAHQLYSDDEHDSQPFHYPPIFSDQQQRAPPNIGSGQYLYEPVTDNTSDGMSSAVNQHAYPQTRSIFSFPVDDGFSYDAMRLQAPSSAYIPPSANDNSNYYYASIHPQISTGAVMDNLQNYPLMPRYTGHPQSHIQQQQSILENDTYGMWSTPSSGLEDDWAHYLSNVNFTTSGTPAVSGWPAREYYR